MKRSFPFSGGRPEREWEGRGLSQAHFGANFVTEKNGKVHFAPRAVMNAAYSGIQTEITATDNGGHCSIWGGVAGRLSN